ncbi:DUF3320 domain-containing protein [Kocuria rhizophila]|uniref:DUF3320 domain-containing protein n=1 Tax=Kocuria rhizophila TaxID=72000 RepID=A0AAX2SE61_KOCRH|nr:DUF3320 domain-containing protein [Kocuria rhizophila]TFI09724.1 DUF3320 domain-containing protein [Kocuria rhizophila]
MRTPQTYETALQGGAVLAHTLRPLVEGHAPVPGDPESWIELISRSDFQRLGRHNAEYALNDPRVILKTIIFHSERFNGLFDRTDIGWATEALRVLNLANSANTSMSSSTVIAGLEAMELILDVVDADKASRRIAELADGRTFEYEELLAGLEPLPTTSRDLVRPAEPAIRLTIGPAVEPIAPPATAEAADPENEGAASTSGDSAPGDSSSHRDEERGGQQTPEHDGEPADKGYQTPEERLNEDLDPYRDVQPGCQTAHFEQGPVKVEVRYREAINFALAHNNVSPVVQILAGHTDQTASHSVDEIVVTLGDDHHTVTADPLRLKPISLPAVREHREYELQERDSSHLAWYMPARQFADIDEATQTSLRINVVIDGHRHTQTHPVALLAHNEWYARSIPELLAAFVTPNSKALVPLMNRASEILRDATGSSSLEGYQSGADRALLIAEAIFRSVQELELSYINPPASFETTGQKIRRVEEVIEDRMGTCLDLSVLYAAALEQAGLNPVIVQAPGHAFAGFLTEDIQLAELALADRGMIDNVVHSGLLVPVEMTAVTGKSSWSDAQRATEAHFDGEIDHVLDIAAAHRRVKPLPRIRTNSAGEVVELVEERPAPTPIPLSVHEEAMEPASYRESEEKNLPPRIRSWRHSLLDLSLRNPLLKLPSRAMSLAVAERSLARLEDMLAAGQRFTVRAHDDIAELATAAGHQTARELGDDALDRILIAEKTLYANISVSSYSSRLDRLRRDAKLALDESGANNLFVTLGALAWKTATDQQALAPLFLLPVRLEGGKKQKYRLSIDEGAKAEPNWCLIEKLRAEFNLSIPVLAEPPEDAHGIDIPRVLREIRTALAVNKVAFHVKPDVRLAILQFATVEMWRDLGDHWEEFLGNPVVKHLVESPLENFEDPAPAPTVTELLEADAVLPVPVDGSQLEAIAWASAGRTFVLEGPPGTGKSQTITNMIANSLDKGKKVLFVAEKQAALEVVRTRLDRVGLAPLTLQVHGRSQTVGDVRRQLLESWEAEAQGNSAAFRALKQDFRRSIESLAAYPQKLHGSSDRALSVWQVHQDFLGLAHQSAQSGGGSEVEDITVPPSLIRDATEAERVAAIAGRAEKALKALGTHRMADDPWRIAGPVASAVTEEPDGPTAMHYVREFLAQHDRLGEQGKALFRRYPDPASWTLLADWLQDVRVGRHMPVADYREVTQCVPDWEASMDLLLADVRQFVHELGDFAAALRPQSWGVNTDDLQRQIRDAQKKLFGGKRAVGEIQQQVEGMVLPTALHLTADAKVFLNHLSWAQERAQKVDMDAERLLPGRAGWTIRDPRQVGLPEDVLQRARLVRSIRRVFSDSDIASFENGAMALDMAGYTNAWQDMLRALNADTESLAQWQGNDDLLSAIDRSREGWRDQAERDRTAGLRRYQRALESVRALAACGLTDISKGLANGSVPADELAARLRLRIAREQLADRLDDMDLLQFDPRERSRRVDEYKALNDRVRSELRTELPSRLLRQRGLKKFRLSPSQVQLRREMDRKRGGTIRQLIESSGDAILDVTPCMLMSPSSVAKNLPVGTLHFDMVIFDEASQIKVADAIGSLGRAKSAVVVGDSQQMPPSSMFASGASEDDDTESQEAVVASDQESILSEAVSANLERKMLTWHYRSQDESLIAYSNQRYYQGELSTFPAPPLARPGFGITLKRVDGHFDGGDRKATRTNRVEAELIVKDVINRLESDPETSIGVVTFNKQQQTLIQDLLEELDNPAVREALSKDEDALIVKNLENMQGDERDVILFSLAFSPDPVTKKMRLQFGPLSAQGGHRRLNVAITRARREVVIYSSFDPEHIDLQRTSSEGMKHLREYLLFARENTETPVADSAVRTRELHREDVAAAFRDAGFEVYEECGMSKFRVDLAVRAEDSPQWFALMLDGPAWAQRSTVSDRDAVPAQVLTQMGWADVIQIWLPSWWQNREQAVQDVRDRMAVISERLIAAETVSTMSQRVDEHQDEGAATQSMGHDEGLGIKTTQHLALGQELESVPDALSVHHTHKQVMSVMNQVLQNSHQSASELDPDAESTEIDPAREEIEVRPFRGAPVLHVGELTVLDALPSRTSRQRVAEQLEDVIEAEGPLLAKELASKVAARFSLGKTNSRRREHILQCVPRDIRKTTTGGVTCYWPRNVDPAEWNIVRVGNEDGAPRGITSIPPQEIENAVAFVLGKSSRALPFAEVTARLNRLMGYGRTGSRIADAYQEALGRLSDSGDAIRQGDLYRLRR